VIEGRGGPADRIVAGGAGRHREGGSCRRVDRVIGLLPSRQMASGIPAIVLSNTGQIVVVTDVAQRAGGRRVRALQQEVRRAVIKLRVQPRIKAVALAAQTRREHRLVGLVAWIRRAIEIRHVARLAGR